MSERRFAVLIANSKFKDKKFSDLQCPINDVNALKEILDSEELGGFHATFIFKNEKDAQFLRRIQMVVKNAVQGDLFLFYYSGHGKLNYEGKLHLVLEETDSDYLESTSISMESIKKLLDSNLKLQKKIVILDCCFSGAGIREWKNKGGSVKEILEQQARGTFFMAACNSLQEAKEFSGEQYSIFTKHIIEGIRSGEADNDRSGKITVDKLFNYVSHQLTEELDRRKINKEEWQTPASCLDFQGEMPIIAKSRRDKKCYEEILKGTDHVCHEWDEDINSGSLKKNETVQNDTPHSETNSSEYKKEKPIIASDNEKNSDIPKDISKLKWLTAAFIAVLLITACYHFDKIYSYFQPEYLLHIKPIVTPKNANVEIGKFEYNGTGIKESAKTETEYKSDWYYIKASHSDYMPKYMVFKIENKDTTIDDKILLSKKKGCLIFDNISQNTEISIKNKQTGEEQYYKPDKNGIRLKYGKYTLKVPCKKEKAITIKDEVPYELDIETLETEYSADIPIYIEPNNAECNISIDPKPKSLQRQHDKPYQYAVTIESCKEYTIDSVTCEKYKLIETKRFTGQDESISLTLVETSPPKKQYTLTINTDPADAKVQIVNPKMAYKPGMLVAPGRYDIEVSKLGYKPFKGTIAVENSEPVKIPSLKKIDFKGVSDPMPPTPPEPPESKKYSLNVNIENIDPKVECGIDIFPKPNDYKINPVKIGVYKIENLEKGRYAITVSCSNYNIENRTVTVPKEQYVDIKLTNKMLVPPPPKTFPLTINIEPKEALELEGGIKEVKIMPDYYKVRNLDGGKYVFDELKPEEDYSVRIVHDCFSDKEILTFRIEKDGIIKTNGVVQENNVINHKLKSKYNLRKAPHNISVNEIDSEKKSFKGDCFVSDYEKGVIKDYATGLMWKISRSDKIWNFEEAEEWIKKYSGWRIPTVSELISLQRKDRMKDGVCINPLFIRENEFVDLYWTSDRIAYRNLYWKVSFQGKCDVLSNDATSAVRAVQTIP
jgi:hypothetical protein